MKITEYIDTLKLYRYNYKDNNDYFNDINNIIKTLITNNYTIKIESSEDNINIQYCNNECIELAFITED